MKKLILLSVLPILFLTACQEQNNEQANEQTKAALMKVNMVQVQPATLTQTLRLSGAITAKEDVAVGTALLGLQIQSVNVEVGDVVKKGQVLATLETSSNRSCVRMMRIYSELRRIWFRSNPL
ncbi:biotin/lipoyl-binding protein [Glaesserella parasuis]|nr:biotin/lipoyl-binding protein [Glaesserella parasuis]